MAAATSSGHPSEFKLKVWRAFGRAVADLHRRNVLRPDVDDVNRVQYDPDTDRATFPVGAFQDVPLSTPATPRDLAENLLPLVQLLAASKEQQFPGMWAVFEAAYLELMDGRGPDVFREMAQLQEELHAAAELNTKALSLAYLGKTAEAVVAFKEGLRLREALGDHEGYCRTLCNLALLYADANDFVTAFKTVDEAISWERRHRRVKGTCLALFQKGLLLNRQGDRKAARGLVELAMRTWQQTGQPVPSQFVELAESLGSGTEPGSTRHGEASARDDEP